VRQARFIREHPHGTDVGEYDGMPYLVSECLEGRNLRERLKAGPMPIAEATAVALGVARDSPPRTTRNRAPRPEAGEHVPEVGWRLASRLWARETQAAARESTGADDTALSMIAGTAAYMAPEQARGESPDPRSDLSLSA
jgi:serine/threonine protein kinase